MSKAPVKATVGVPRDVEGFERHQHALDTRVDRYCGTQAVPPDKELHEVAFGLNTMALKSVTPPIRSAIRLAAAGSM